MSLLNEMLHDLAKQKTEKNVAPLLNPAVSTKASPRIILVSMCCLALILFVITLIGINKQGARKNTVVAKHQAKSALTPVKSEAEPKHETLALTSYIEPMSSPSSFKVTLQEPNTEQESLNEWIDAQLEPELATPEVKKVYSPLSPEEWKDAQLNKALKAIDDGFDEEAIHILEATLAKAPKAIDVRENLASLYISYGDYNHAIKVVSDGLKYSPADAGLITIKARLLLDQNNADAAIKLLSNYRPSMSVYPDFYGTLAAALQSKGRIMEAGSLYKALLQVDPDNGQYWLGYGIALETNHQANQAIEAYNRAIQKPDSDASVRNYAENRLKTLQG